MYALEPTRHSPGQSRLIVMPVMNDRFCFSNAIDLALIFDYDEIVTVDHVVNKILEQLVANVDYYKQLHTCDLIWDTEGHSNLETIATVSLM